MSIVIYILLGAGFLFLWYFVGAYEWKVPETVAGKIAGLGREKRIKTVPEESKETACLFFVRTWPTQDLHGEIEKQRHLLKIKRNRGLEMRVLIKGNILVAEREKMIVKLRLENRFPGLTVKFIETEGKE
ncbi:MAG: hypothetical protein ACOX7U_05095 [Desulfitobacteriia bacterium]